jgi:mRNA-degrading endonuclease RelE of RelBE toxin-antitoxin system
VFLDGSTCMSHPAKVWIHNNELDFIESLEANPRERLVNTLLDVAEESYPLHHSKCEVEKAHGLLKVKVGDMRAICRWERGTLFILLVGHRENFYSDIDLAARRASLC